MFLISSDLTIEDVHFRAEWAGWEAGGRRAAAGALSDLAAMAARPLGVLVSLALPVGPGTDDVIEALGRGVGDCLRGLGVPLLGGDLSRSPGPVMLDVVCVGCSGAPLSRAGARPGDELWVTGSLGGAAAAVRDWLRGREPTDAARRAYGHPAPRIREALWLAERATLHAGIDLSDGLARDAAHLAAASGRCMEIELDALPLHRALRAERGRPPAPGRPPSPGRPPATGRGEAGAAAEHDAVRLALTGGEDYELLLAAPPGVLGSLSARFESDTGTPLTRIGRVAAGEGVVWRDRAGEEVALPVRGFDHFA